MRIAAFITTLCFSYAVVPQSAVGMETVTTCTLGSDHLHTVALLRDHLIGDTAAYYLSTDGFAPVRLYRGDDDQSRGEDMQVSCVGTNEHALVMSGEFTSNYLQGIAVRYNTGAGRWERVDFAERSRPTAVYLDRNGMAVLIPNLMRNEAKKRYIIYRYDGDRGSGEQTYSDRLPQSPAAKIPAPANRSDEQR